MVYQLRNSAAHGNQFKFTGSGKKRLKAHEAHNRLAAAKTSEFEITESLDGQPVLFDFMERADVLELMISVGLYLIRKGNGEPLRPWCRA